MATALTTLLAAAETAIVNLLAGKFTEVKVGEVTYTRHNLDALRKFRNELRREIAGGVSHGVKHADLRGFDQ